MYGGLSFRLTRNLLVKYEEGSSSFHYILNSGAGLGLPTSHPVGGGLSDADAIPDTINHSTSPFAGDPLQSYSVDTRTAKNNIIHHMRRDDSVSATEGIVSITRIC